MSQQYCENFRTNDQAELVEILPPSYVLYRYLHNLHSFWLWGKSEKKNDFLKTNDKNFLCIASYDKLVCIKSWQKLANFILLCKTPSQEQLPKRCRKHSVSCTHVHIIDVMYSFKSWKNISIFHDNKDLFQFLSKTAWSQNNVTKLNYLWSFYSPKFTHLYRWLFLIPEIIKKKKKKKKKKTGMHRLSLEPLYEPSFFFYAFLY